MLARRQSQSTRPTERHSHECNDNVWALVSLTLHVHAMTHSEATALTTALCFIVIVIVIILMLIFLGVAIDNIIPR